jgi:UDP-N-acetylglucosamine--N-acetylmuramyl-(pentapeptide) pyrophosphoryl-undecaprenol N-acetylglucosamine transferase
VKASKIVIGAGGTAGHVVPALAVADALRADGAEVEFIGGTRAEARLVPAAGFALHALAVEALRGTRPLRAARALARAAAATVRARSLLRTLAPGAVMGGGGYVAGPVVLAAYTLRLPVVLTEADSKMGLTNRVLAPLARRVCLSFPPSSRPSPAAVARSSRYRVTGRPTLRAAHGRAEARQHFGVSEHETCVVVFGGSLGARSINLAAMEAFADASFAVLHICGERDYPELAARTLRPGYRLYEQLEPANFFDALAASDLAVARAGGSVFEIAAHGLPAVLIPYPHAAGDHQSANARWMTAAGAAVVLPDEELSASRLAREVAALLANGAHLAAMASASRSLARPDAAREVALELLEAARG